MLYVHVPLRQLRESKVQVLGDFCSVKAIRSFPVEFVELDAVSVARIKHPGGSNTPLKKGASTRSKLASSLHILDCWSQVGSVLNRRRVEPFW